MGPLASLALVAFVRISGKRPLSKMNALALVIAITLGWTFTSDAVHIRLALGSLLLCVPAVACTPN